MVRLVLARFAVCLTLIALVVPVAADARPPQVTTLDVSADGLRARIDVPADAEPWTGLVALPPGRTLLPGDLPAGVSVGEIAIMHGVRVAPLTVAGRPDQATSVTLDLSFAAGAPRVGERTVLAASFARLIESATLGGDAVRAEYDEVPGTYLMVCSSTAGVLESVAPLAEWRRQQGYAVEVVTTATTGTTNTAIKNYIQQVYDTAAAPLAYVVLVGDEGGTVGVATWRETISGYYGEGDHEYTLLDGNDVLSDVHIGRLSCRSVSELDGIVAKILGYERSPDTFTDPDWFTRAVLVGDPSHSGTTTIYVNQWLKERLLQLNYTDIDTIWSGNFASQITAEPQPGRLGLYLPRLPRLQRLQHRLHRQPAEPGRTALRRHAHLRLGQLREHPHLHRGHAAQPPRGRHRRGRHRDGRHPYPLQQLLLPRRLGRRPDRSRPPPRLCPHPRQAGALPPVPADRGEHRDRLVGLEQPHGRPGHRDASGPAQGAADDVPVGGAGGRRGVARGRVGERAAPGRRPRGAVYRDGDLSAVGLDRRRRPGAAALAGGRAGRRAAGDRDRRRPHARTAARQIGAVDVAYCAAVDGLAWNDGDDGMPDPGRDPAADPATCNRARTSARPPPRPSTVERDPSVTGRAR